MPAVPAAETIARTVARPPDEIRVLFRPARPAVYFALPHRMFRPCARMGGHLHKVAVHQVSQLPLHAECGLVDAGHSRPPDSCFDAGSRAGIIVHRIHAARCHPLDR